MFRHHYKCLFVCNMSLLITATVVQKTTVLKLPAFHFKRQDKRKKMKNEI